MDTNKPVHFCLFFFLFVFVGCREEKENTVFFIGEWDFKDIEYIFIESGNEKLDSLIKTDITTRMRFTVLKMEPGGKCIQTAYDSEEKKTPLGMMTARYYLKNGNYFIEYILFNEYEVKIVFVQPFYQENEFIIRFDAKRFYSKESTFAYLGIEDTEGLFVKKTEIGLRYKRVQ